MFELQKNHATSRQPNTMIVFGFHIEIKVTYLHVLNFVNRSKLVCCITHLTMYFIAVDLFTAGHGDEPILIDKTPPEVGTVLDGNKLQKDLRYQADNRQICAQWLNFFDPESGIDRYDFFIQKGGSYYQRFLIFY